jgi:hypothetical protein
LLLSREVGSTYTALGEEELEKYCRGLSGKGCWRLSLAGGERWRS